MVQPVSADPPDSRMDEAPEPVGPIFKVVAAAAKVKEVPVVIEVVIEGEVSAHVPVIVSF